MSTPSLFTRLGWSKSPSSSKGMKSADLSRTLGFVVKVFFLMVACYVFILIYCGFLTIKILDLRDGAQHLSELNRKVIELKSELNSNFLLSPDSMRDYAVENGEHKAEVELKRAIQALEHSEYIQEQEPARLALAEVQGGFETYQAAFKSILEQQAQQPLQGNQGPSLTLLGYVSDGSRALARIEDGAATLEQLNKQGRDWWMRLMAIGVSVGSILLILTLLGLGILISRTRKKTNETLVTQAVAAREAEAENENINNSAILLLQAVSQIADRDLTVRAPVTQDVIGTVADSINVLAEETQKVLQGVSGVAAQVQLVSGKVRTQAQLVADTAQTEREHVNSMVDSLYRATQVMNEVASMTEQSKHSAGQATQVTEDALETVNVAVRGMESIRETIAETEKRIKRLGERSQEISGIVNLINTIAERTHVLALNAAMQAAVAGEAGRGFAVVAEEVQRLAESSRNATQQIATLVNNIQIETNETINTVNRTIGQVVQGSEQAQKAGEQMRRTQAITTELVTQVRGIARASDEQKVMGQELLASVRQIGDSTEQTAQQIQAQNIETELLQDAARQLVESVGVFRLHADDVPRDIAF